MEETKIQSTLSDMLESLQAYIGTSRVDVRVDGKLVYGASLKKFKIDSKADLIQLFEDILADLKQPEVDVTDHDLF